MAKLTQATCLTLVPTLLNCFPGFFVTSVTNKGFTLSTLGRSDRSNFFLPYSAAKALESTTHV